MGNGDEPRKDERPLGRDEMNLAEFPMTLLTDQASKGVKTLAFEDRHGRLTVTGSDDYGLPTAPDADVIVALIQLTKLRNDFTNPTVEFTRYELLKLLGWEDKGRNYRRLGESLHRWVGVTLRYDGCWWDNRRKRRVNASFHILEYVILPDEDDPGISSCFAWNNVFFKNCQAGNLKQLDLETYFSLKSAVSKQTYRFLDKRFYHRPAWIFDLREFAHEHVGLGRNYADNGKLKEKLQPALEELESIGFLEPMTNADRYTKVGRGDWQIRLIRKRPASVEIKPEPEPEPAGLVRELIDRGVTAAKARDLVRDFPEDRIKAQIENVDRTRRKIKDKAAYLVSAIREDFATPKAIAPPVKAEPVPIARTTKAVVDVSWRNLGPEERARIDAAALADADPALRAQIEGETRPFMRRLLLSAARDAYLNSIRDVSASDPARRGS
jgi:hypothetical protein